MSIIDLGSGPSTGGDPARYSFAILSAFARRSVEARQATPPTGLTDDGSDVGRAWIVEATASGDWSGAEGKLAVWLGTAPGWRLITVPEGMVFYVQDEDLDIRADGSDGWTGVTLGNIGDGSVAPAKLVDANEATWLGRLDGVGTGPPAYQTIADLIELLNATGGLAPTALTGSGTLPSAALPATSVTTARLQGGAVTNPKLADMAQATVKGRATASGTGQPVDLTAAQLAAIYESVSDRNAYTDAEKTKVGYLTVTGAVDLDTVVDETRTITAGTGLTGGGDLSADRTIGLADTTVTAGSYGAADTVATFTVDAQGRITDASDVAIAIAAGAVSGLATVATSGDAIDLSGLATLTPAHSQWRWIIDRPTLAEASMFIDFRRKAYAQTDGQDLLPITFADLVSITRASEATYFDGSGTLRTAAVGEARIDHNMATGERIGLLIEDTRTNDLTHNRDLTDTAWSKTDCTAAKDQVGIDGASNSASSVEATAANATVLQSVTAASAERVSSAYVRRLTGSGVIEMTQDGGSTWVAVTVTSDWTRVELASATVTNPEIGFRIVTSGDKIAVDFVQCEIGSVATSPIETTTSPITRVGDVVTVNDVPAWLRDPGEGTVLVRSKWAEKRPVSSINRSVILTGGGGSERVRIWNWSGSDNFMNTISVAGSEVVATSVTEAEAGATLLDMTTCGIAYDATSAYAAVNGHVTSPQSTGSAPSSLESMEVGGGADCNVWIEWVAFIPRKLSTSELGAITG